MKVSGDSACLRCEASRFQRSPCLVCALLLLVFQRISLSIDYHSIIRSLHHLKPAVLVQALLATTLSFLALVARDAIGLRYIGAKVPHPLLWIGATVGSALGNATGFGALTGGAVRCRVYGAAGIKPVQVGRLTAFTSVTLALALILLTSLGAIGAAPMLSRAVHVSQTLLHVSGGLGIALLASLLLCCRREPRPVSLGRIGFDIPARSVMSAQLAFAAIDVVTAGMALWVLLPHANIGFASFIAIFSAAMLLGIVGHTPGGLGVFEAAMVLALGSSVHTSEMVAALLVYRTIYLGAPLALSAALLAAFEGRTLTARLAIRSSRGINRLAPTFLSIFTFVVGSMLVVSGARRRSGAASRNCRRCCH